MYIPKHFEESKFETILEDMRRMSFATLITPSTNDGLQISHLPLVVKGETLDTLSIEGHMARGNHHWRTFEQDLETVAVFNGPHSYISPSWYEASEAVPTWNYIVVHASGTARCIPDPNRLVAHLKELVGSYESGNHAWNVEKMPDGLFDQLLKGIVFFELKIHRLEEKAKLGQNRSTEDIYGAIAGLRQLGDPMAIEVAALMGSRCLNR